MGGDMGKLTESMIRDLEPREKVYSVWDGEGLYLEVAPNGAKRWRTQYSMGGKKRVAAHGVWPKVLLRVWPKAWLRVWPKVWKK